MLTKQTEQRLREVAAREGIDPERLIAVARRMDDGFGAQSTGEAGAGQANQPKLYMYLLPFVKVSEVRQVFLGLSEPFPGDNEVASDWAAKHPVSASGQDGQPVE